MSNKNEDAHFITLTDEGSIESRHVMIAGVALTLRIESSYWRALEDICRREKMSSEEVIDDILQRLEEQRANKSLSIEWITPSLAANAIRVFVVGYFRQAATEIGHQKAGHGKGEIFIHRSFNEG